MTENQAVGRNAESVGGKLPEIWQRFKVCIPADGILSPLDSPGLNINTNEQALDIITTVA